MKILLFLIVCLLINQSDAVDCVHAVVMHKSGSSVLGHLLKSLYPKECVTEQSTVVDIEKFPKCAVIVNFFRNYETKRNRIFDKRCSKCTFYLQIRHPLDTMVSMYNSFTTMNHAIPAHYTKKQKEEEIKNRAIEHALGVDKYALSHIQNWVRRVELHMKLLEEARVKYNCDVYMSHYEDFVSRTREWAHLFAMFMSLTNEQTKRIKKWAVSQSHIVVNATKHTSYVYPGAYVKIMKPETVLEIMHHIGMNSSDIVKYSGYF